MSDNLSLVPLSETMQLGDVIAKSGFFDDSRQQAQAVVKVLAGRELGIGPIAAMTGIHIIKGKPSIGANIMAGLIKRGGRYTYRVRQLDATACQLEFFERSGESWESLGISSMTIDEARKAGTQNLDKFPRNMLFARAISNGARWYCPDIFGGAPVYTPEELGAPVDEDGDVIEASYKPVEERSVIETKTPGNNGHTEQSPTAEFDAMPSATATVTATEKQRKAIFALANQYYGTAHMEEQFRAWLVQNYGTNSTKSLTAAQASQVIDILKTALAENGPAS